MCILLTPSIRICNVYFCISGNKKLLTPQPRLRSGFFSELEASSLPPTAMAEACTAIGVAKYGRPLGLDAKLKVDLLVIGSVAVNPKTGARLGKGEVIHTLIYCRSLLYFFRFCSLKRGTVLDLFRDLQN